MTLLMLSWWVLIVSGTSGDIPKAMGPYPSEDFCLVAARQLMPKERRFWTQAERTAQDVKDKAEQVASAAAAKKQEAEIAAIPLATRQAKAKAGQGMKLSDGETVFFEKDGLYLKYWGISYGTLVPHYYPPTALTDCASISTRGTP